MSSPPKGYVYDTGRYSKFRRLAWHCGTRQVDLSHSGGFKTAPKNLLPQGPRDQWPPVTFFALGVPKSVNQFANQSFSHQSVIPFKQGTEVAVDCCSAQSLVTVTVERCRKIKQ